MPRRPSILISDLKPGMIVPAHVHECPACLALFLASKDAVYCSNACRMRRTRKGAAKDDD